MPEMIFPKKELQRITFGPNFLFLGTALGRFTQFFFYLSLSANHGDLNFCSAPPPPTIKKLPTALIEYKDIKNLEDFIEPKASKLKDCGGVVCRNDKN